MIDLKDLRSNPEKYRTGARQKGVAVDIDALLAADEQARNAQTDFDRLRSEQNQISAQIGKAKDAGEREQLKVKAAEYKPKLADLSEKMREAQAKVEKLILAI